MRMLMIAVAAMLLAGCTSAGGYSSNSRLVVDWEEVARIERAARASGVDVVWVQYPMKRVSTTSGLDPLDDTDASAQPEN